MFESDPLFVLGVVPVLDTLFKPAAPVFVFRDVPEFGTTVPLFVLVEAPEFVFEVVPKPKPDRIVPKVDRIVEVDPIDPDESEEPDDPEEPDVPGDPADDPDVVVVVVLAFFKAAGASFEYTMARFPRDVLFFGMLDGGSSEYVIPRLLRSVTLPFKASGG